MTYKDYEILSSLLDKDDKEKGIIPTKGLTIADICEKTNTSSTKVRTCISNFVALGYVEKEKKKKNARSYILTESGISKILELGGKK